MIALIDYDAGNIKSVEKAFQSLGKEVVLTRDPDVLKRADHVVLPGVGSFGDAMENLNRYHLVPVIHEIVEKGTPFLGICLGLQVLFERSEESPGVAGLGLLKGEILRIPDKEGLKIPHMGWNSLHLQKEGRLFKGIPQESYVYFVHSYYLKAEEEEIVKATTEYSTHIHASVEKGNLFACQFHKMMTDGYLIQIITGTPLIKGKGSKHKRIGRRQKLAVWAAGSFCKRGNLASFSGEKDDPLVIFSHRHGREHYSLHSYQITHSLCFLTVFLFRFPSYRNQSS